jgi:hypothetical protein
MAVNQYGQNFSGNDDFRGYLAALSEGGDKAAQAALGFVGNDGVIDTTSWHNFFNNNSSNGQVWDPATNTFSQATPNPFEDAARFGSNAKYYNAEEFVKNMYSGWSSGRSDGAAYSTQLANQQAQIAAANAAAAAQQKAIDDAKAEEERLAKEEEARVRDYNRGFLADRKTELEELLGRTDTLEKQGLDKILRAYDDERIKSQNDKTKQMANYNDLKTEQGTNKVSSFEKLNQGANQAYRSLAQIIGRGAGTGSSAFRDLLPNAIGNQVSSGREGVLQDYGQNMQKIGKSKKEYESSFEEVLRDLLNQKTASEGSFKSGLDTERQNVNLQLMEVLRQNQLNEDPKSKYETVRAAIEPYKAANTKLSNNIDNYYEQYKPTMTPKAAVINKPDLGQFTVDRANINAQNQGVVDNPYASLLRKRLEER